MHQFFGVVTGINHLTLSVRDVAESFDFYVDVLGLRPLARWPKGAYLLAGDLWVALVLDGEARSTPLPEYTHVAFSVGAQDFPALSERVRRSGAPIWQDNWTEGDSLYFVDPNGHKLEIHSSDLRARLQTAREKPWEGLEFFELRISLRNHQEDAQHDQRRAGQTENGPPPLVQTPDPPQRDENDGGFSQRRDHGERGEVEGDQDHQIGDEHQQANRQSGRPVGWDIRGDDSR
jgi:catechol 2,3-dioxygenase-like lactoylglutathione lyase family enzyme